LSLIMQYNSKEEAALTLQRVWRGGCGRARVMVLMESTILNEAQTSVLKVQKAWRGHSSRERTMRRLEAMMVEEVDDAAARICSGLKSGPGARCDHQGSESSSPREDVPEMELAYEFESSNIQTIQKKLLNVQCQASKLAGAMDALGPALIQKEPESGTISHPFQELSKHESLKSMTVCIVGLSECGRILATCLCRAGVGAITLILTELSTEEPLGFLKALGSSNTDAKLCCRRADASDSGGLDEASQGASLIVLCSDRITDREAVIKASISTGTPWVLVEESLEIATFRFQFFVQGVIDVLEHDVVASPIIEHMFEEGVMAEMDALVKTLAASAGTSFAGLLAHSIALYWMGDGAAPGYIWHCAVFNKLSSIALSQLGRSV